MSNILRPLKIAKLKDDNIGTFDIETRRDVKTGTANAKNFLYGVVYDGEKYQTFWDSDLMFAEMCRRKYKGWKWFAHNAEYDLSGLMENIITDSDEPPLYNDSRFIFYKKTIYSRDTGRVTKDGKPIIHNEHITFLDSMKYFQTKLSSLGEGIGLKKLVDQHLGAMPSGPQSQAKCRRGLAFAVTGIDLYESFIEHGYMITTENH